MFSIIGESNVRTFTKESNFKQVYHYACLSTDNKPTTGISNGSTCIVMNTGKTYIFDEENGEWEELPGSGGGGGGGGGDYSTVKVTGIDTTEFAEFLALPILSNTPDGKTVVATFGMPCDGNQYDVVLYKGLAYTQASGTYNTYSAEGDCVITEESGDYIISITGDCIITISEKQQ